MFTKVSVLIPTRGRVGRLQTLLESYRRTTSGEGDSELVFRVDNDDRETYDYLMATPHAVKVGPRMRGYLSMPDFFNELAAVATGDVLMCGNDDMVFQTEDWPTMLLEVANTLPDGLFDIGVNTHNETHFPFSVVSRRVVEKLGFIWDPKIFWGDIYLRDIMLYFGRCVMVPQVQIDHDWAGWKPDKVFMESDKDITGRDPNYWAVTHRVAVDGAIGRLKELLA